MTDWQIEQLVQILKEAIGPEKAITLDRVAALMGSSRRVVEQLIEDRLSDLPFTVVAGGGGYYRPTTSQHLNAYLHNLHSRHRRMQLREATVRRKARLDGWLEEGGRFVSTPVQQELFT